MPSLADLEAQQQRNALELKQIEAQLELEEIEKKLGHSKKSQKSGVGLTSLIPTSESIKKGIKDIPRQMALTGRNAVASLGNIVDAPYLPFEIARYGIEKVRGKDPTFGKWMPQTAEKIKHTIDSATGDYTKPRTPTEEYVGDIVESVATLPWGWGIGKLGQASKVSPLVKVGKVLEKMHEPTRANIGAAAMAPVAVHKYQENVQDPGPWGSLLAGAAGSVLGGYGAAKGPSALKKILTTNPKDVAAELVGKVTKFSPERYEKWQKLGIPSTLGSASESTRPLGIELTLARLPGTHQYISPILQERLKKIAQHAGIHEEDLSAAVSHPKEYLVKEGALKHKQAKSAEYTTHEAGWDEFEKELIRNQTTTDVSDILKKLEDDYKLGALKATDLKHFRKTFPGQVYEDLKDSIKDYGFSEAPDLTKMIRDLQKQGLSSQMASKYAAELLSKTPSSSPNASLQVLKNLKEKALNRAQSPTLSLNEKRKASDIHTLLRDKMTQVMEQHGTPNQVKGAKEAKKLWADYASPKQSDMQRNVEELLEKRTDTSAFRSLTTADKKHLEAASKYLDQNQRFDLAESIIASVGKKDGFWDPVKAFGAVEKWSPKVQHDFLSLFKTTQQRENFLNVKKLVEENKQRFQQIANTSGTASTTAVIDSGKSLAKSLGKVAAGLGTAQAAHIVAGAKGVTTLIGGYLLVKGGAKLWTDPVFLERINRVMKAKKPAVMGQNLSLLLKTPSVKKLLGKGSTSLINEGVDNSDEE